MDVTQPRRVKQVVSPLVAQQPTALWPRARTGHERGARAGLPHCRQVGHLERCLGEAGYENDEVITSFVGYGPLPNPRWVIRSSSTNLK